MRRFALIMAGLVLVVAVLLAAGLRQSLLVILGMGFGATLQGARFGFTTGWRDYIEQRNPQGLWAQMLLISLAAILTLPLIATSGGEIVGAIAPLTISLVLGAFVFGASMQLADGCGSGTLYKAGVGTPMSFAVLPTFAIGSFVGASHQPAWIALGGYEPVSLLDHLGLPAATILTVAGCALVAYLAARGAKKRLKETGRPVQLTWARRWWVGALVLAVLYVLHMVVAGQPWGIVYGIGLWGAKVFQALGWSPVGDAFWGASPHAERLAAPVLADVTSITNIGLLFGAFAAARWNGPADFKPSSAKRIFWACVAGLVMGYSSRMSFGCNVGAFLDGIASASVHGWVWFAMAFLGSILGVRLRRRIEA